MDGNSKDQIDHILGTTRQMVEYFRTSKVKKNESNSILLKNDRILNGSLTFK